MNNPFGQPSLFGRPNAFPLHYYGLYFLTPHTQFFLPLESVQANVTINDIAARVTLTQEYHHDNSAFPTLDAKYSFPLPVKASVNSFAMIKQDGTRVVGVVQEKQEAKETFDKAVEEGKLASLMEQDHPDVFSVSVGNILFGERVKIELSFVIELAEDEDNDSIRFTLPTFISERYGSNNAPTSNSSTLARANSRAFFNLNANIETATPIAKISCPSHTIETELGPDPSLPNAKELPFSNFARVSLTSSTSLTKDFVLAVKSAGLDAPRCIAEVHPGKDSDSLALALTMVPRFKLPDLANQEFVFLVDRSGSMGGWGGQARIEVAKKALVVMLRSLPHKDTFFNVVSFGSSHSSLWPKAVAYNQKTLDEATKHVDGMSADMGGTEIRLALESVFAARKTDRPTSLFVLTDGDAWDLEATLESVKSAVSNSPRNAYLRVFTLGIGNSASTAMVEGIARVGNGSSTFVQDNESFTGKTARLLKAARAPLIRNIRVSWGVDGAPGVTSKEGEKMDVEKDDGFELLSATETEEVSAPKKISLFDTEDDEPLVSPAKETLAPAAPIVLPPPSPLQQSPFTIQSLSPATRLYVYAILSTPAWKKGDAIPKSVTLKGSLDSGAEVELEIPVSQSHLSTNDSFPPPVHTLAAKKLIQDYLDGQHSLSEDLDPDTLQRTVEAYVVRLGKMYSITSKYTSFVCVDESEAKRAREKVVMLAPQPVFVPTPTLFGGGGGVRARTLLSRSSGPGVTMFGSAQPSAPAAFGAFAPPQYQQQSLFRSPAPALQSIPQPQSSAAAFGGFGSPASSQFSAVPTGYSPQPPGFSFGASQQANSPSASGSLFGGASTQGGALFGQSATGVDRDRSSASSGGLFGSANVEQSRRGGGFSSGAPAPQMQQQQQSAAPQAFSFGAIPSARRSSGEPFGTKDTEVVSFGADTFSSNPFSGGSGLSSSAFGNPGYAPSPKPAPLKVPLSEADQLDAIVREQAFDGSFGSSLLAAYQLSSSSIKDFVESLSQEIRKVLTEDVLERVAATLVAMFCLSKLESEKEAWEGVYAKASEFVTDVLRDAGYTDRVDVGALGELVMKDPNFK